MKIIRPVAITDAMFISSTVAETDYSEWSVSTPYVIGNNVMVTTSGVHKTYECLANVTGGSSPEIDVLAEVPKWLELGATNKWKVFDQIIGSQTAASNTMAMVIKPGVVDSIALLNLDAVSIDIVITDPVEGVVYTKSVDLLTTETSIFQPVVINWYTYFFEQITKRADFALFDLPPYLNEQISITITYNGGTAKVGCIVVGLQAYVGITRPGIEVGLIDYSTKTTDTFGNYTIYERAYSKRMTVPVLVPNINVDELSRQFSFYRATPIVWIADTRYSTTMIYGFYKDFTITMAAPIYADCSLQIEGLT